MAQNNMFTHSKFLNVQARVVIPRLIFNLIPVMGILVLGWDVFAVIVLYWLDSALIIVFNALKMLFAQVDDTDRISGMFGSIFIRFCPVLRLTRANKLHRAISVQLSADAINPAKAQHLIQNVTNRDVFVTHMLFVGYNPHTFSLGVVS
jgi:hypothetical protein